MDKKYAIFDMDGTLVDSMGYWRRLGREFLAENGMDAEHIEKTVGKIKRMTMEESSALFIEALGLECRPEELSDKLNAVMERHYRKDVGLKPGIVEYLEKLKNRGCRMCVATATARPLAMLCLDRLGLSGYFEFILSCAGDQKGKEDPDVFLKAARRLGGTPEETAVFEDAPYAAQTAKNAGFWTVGVKDINMGKWEELQPIADEFVEHW